MTADLAVEDLGLGPSEWSTLPAEQVRRFAAALDLPDEPVPGDALPLPWHWALFTPSTPTAGLGPDGHPRLAEQGPTAGLPRRMFLGGSLRQRHPLRIGQPAQRLAEVVSCEHKSGRSGPLLIVTVRLRYRQDDREALEEEQVLVYRAGGSPAALPEGDHRPDVQPPAWSEPRTVDPVQLFRFSALTFNSHRIHYDREYASREEGYPRLVVHGPLTAVLLAESARARMGPLRSFRFSARAPLFEGVTFTLVGEPAGSAVTLRAVRNDGATAVEAAAEV